MQLDSHEFCQSISFGDTTYFLEELIKGLKAKQQAGTWDRSLNVKEQLAEYLATNADLPLLIPNDLENNSEFHDLPS